MTVCAGCASYTTPGGPASLAAMQAGEAAPSGSALPVPSYPVSVNVVRVQAADYASLSAERIAGGAFSVVMPPELSTLESMQAISQWPLVTDAGVLRASLLPPELTSLDDLRLAAAKNLADVLIVYTVDTRFEAGGRKLDPLVDISLGEAPAADACVTASASAVFIDVRTGLRYATAQSSARADDLGDAWKSATALDRRRIDVEKQAFVALLSESEKVWARIAGHSEFSQAPEAPATAVR